MTAAKKMTTASLIFDYEKVPLTDKMYLNFARRIYDLAGVDLPLSPKNQALVRNRIIKLLRKNQHKSFEAYWDYIQNGSEQVTSEFISALTTNMTSFFRETEHFTILKDSLPDFAKRFGSDIRVWCAAASTGQEPYTIVLTMKDIADQLPPGTRTRLLATDIDLQVLKKAESGIYDEKEMSGMPPVLRNKYFTKTKNKDGEVWKVSSDLQSMVRFAPFNLMNPKYEFQKKFHIIFCRNVLIYFDEATTKRVIDNLVSCLEVGGYLVLGHSESGNVKHSQLKSMSRAVYQKV